MIQRLWLLLYQKRRQSVLHRWRPLLMSGLYGQSEALPALSRFDLPHVLALWNHLHETLGLEARNRLAQMAGQMRIPAAVSRMLRNKRFQARSLAARTAGNLQLASTWDLLLEMLADDSSALSLLAARALLQIDAERAIHLLIPHLTGHKSWQSKAVMNILELAGSGRVAAPLLQAVETLPADQSRQLIPYLQEIAPTEAKPFITRILASPDEDEKLLIICLDGLSGHDDLEAVRALVRYPNWHVRVHALKALARIGTREDVGLLTEMLGDGQWWVRYRAAQALSQLPEMSANELFHLKDSQADSEARDMLHHVMAERELRLACRVSEHG